MTTPKDDGGPFHPAVFKGRDEGASFRAVAALHAMAALIAHPETGHKEGAARAAVEYADALIAELKK